MVHPGTDSFDGSTTDTLTEEDESSDYSDRVNTSPSIVPVYNGRVLDISPELIIHALSGISCKHYDGSCSEPKRSSVSEDSIPGEEYVIDYGELILDEEEFSGEKSRTSSSGMGLCYIPRRHERGAGSENAPEGESEAESQPPCVLDKIRDRNSFWNLHRPELCKLTWPRVYVGEATITEHLHRHLLHHGQICSGFHERRDILALLDKELDSYDKLKELQPPRELPPDEKPFDTSGNRKSPKTRPCNPCMYRSPGSVNWSDESDLDLYQSLHLSKEEFCITIGKPVRRPKLRGLPVPEPEQIWLPGEEGVDEYGEYPGFMYPEFWEEAGFTVCEGEAEDGQGEEVAEPEVVLQEPIGWVEPDFCAML